jgi:hypothetical protein
MGGACSMRGRDEKCIQPEGTRTRKARHRWEGNIKMDLTEILWTGCIWLRIWTSCGLLLTR